MNVDNQFLGILDDCINKVKKYIDNNQQYDMYIERYKRMIAELEEIKRAINAGALAKDFWSLEVTKMLDMNDPKDIKDSILSANAFYCKYYQKL